MVNVMKLPIGSRCVKYLMFVFNLFFVITGIILLSIGLVIHGVYHNYQHFLDNKFFSVPSLLVAIGAIIFFIAFFGCCGAVRENYCMIITFTSLLVLVFILELSGGISGYVLRGRASTIIKDKMLDSMKEYNSKDVAFVWDKVQREFDCCGTNNATDWISGTNARNSTDIPLSCCRPSTIPISSCTLNSTNLNEKGCYPKFVSYIKAHALDLGGVGLGIAFVQALGIWFSIHLAKSMRNSYETV